jgi:hypothetical protein
MRKKTWVFLIIELLFDLGMARSHGDSETGFLFSYLGEDAKIIAETRFLCIWVTARIKVICLWPKYLRA